MIVTWHWFDLLPFILSIFGRNIHIMKHVHKKINMVTLYFLFIFELIKGSMKYIPNFIHFLLWVHLSEYLFNGIKGKALRGGWQPSVCSSYQIPPEKIRESHLSVRENPGNYQGDSFWDFCGHPVYGRGTERGRQF